MEDKKFCPLSFAADDTMDCLKEKCAWWAKIYRRKEEDTYMDYCCAIKAIAERMK